MIFRIIAVCLLLAGCYGAYEVYSIQQHYRWLRTPAASFAVLGDREKANLTIVEFLNYSCGYCRESHKILLDYQKRNPNVVLVVRPVPYTTPGAEETAGIVLAAGLQGKFWEIDNALMEYDGPLDDKFFKETASLYDLDHDRLMEDAKGEDVFRMAKDNAEASQSAGIKLTPAFMIGKTVYQLDKPLTLSDLIQMVQREQRD